MVERREAERRMSLAHDIEACPLAAEVSDCNRERGEIAATLVAIKDTLARLQPVIDTHERWIQQSRGAMALVAVICTIAGGLITTLFAWLTRAK